MYKFVFPLLLLILSNSIAQNYADTTLIGDASIYTAKKTKKPIVIDADASDKAWSQAKWAPMPHVWLEIGRAHV